MQSVRILQCDWDDRQQFVQDMVGSVVLNGNSIFRTIPELHPKLDWLYAAACDLIPVVLGVPGNATGDMIEYVPGLARYRVTYRTLPYRVVADDAAQTTELYRYVERRWKPSVESLVTRGRFIWVTAPKDTIWEPLSILQPSAVYEYVWHQVPVAVDILLPATLQTNINAALGTMNSAAFDSGRFAARQLLCVAPEIVLTQAANADYTYRITYPFMYRENGWHKVYRPLTTGGSYQEVTETGTSLDRSIYATSNFDNLFKIV